jgi:xanthine/CO dehydrogenase XdhC/CoxF family maturation factor
MLKEEIKLTLKDAAKKLTGSKKRAFMAQVTIDYWNSSPRKAETELGWSRKGNCSITTGGGRSRSVDHKVTKQCGFQLTRSSY